MTELTAPPPAGISPTLVGLLRGLVYAAGAAVLAAVVAFAKSLDAGDLGRYSWALPLLLAGARALEGRIDKGLGQARQVPTGGRPANPADYGVGAGHAGLLPTLEPLVPPFEPAEPVGIGDALAGEPAPEPAAPEDPEARVVTFGDLGRALEELAATLGRRIDARTTPARVRSILKAELERRH